MRPAVVRIRVALGGAGVSALGAAVGKGIGAVGGPQVAALVVAGGLVVGALGGGFIAGGQGPAGHDRAAASRSTRAPTAVRRSRPSGRARSSS